MAYITTYRWRRPNANIPWHLDANPDPACFSQILELNLTEFYTKKIRNRNEPNELTLEVEWIWESKAVYDDWMSRDIVIQGHQVTKNYNNSVGIVADPIEISEI